MKGHGITLDDKVLAYFVLNCANLSDESTAICRGTCPELSYANMRKQTKKIAAPEKPRSKADTIISDEFFVENVPEKNIIEQPTSLIVVVIGRSHFLFKSYPQLDRKAN